MNTNAPNTDTQTSLQQPAIQPAIQPALVSKLNETGLRSQGDRRKVNDPSQAPAGERRKKQRRRQIDPTTCERDYSEAEIEFMRAMDEYKRSSGRMFPTCSEILEVLHGIGYRKVADDN